MNHQTHHKILNRFKVDELHLLTLKLKDDAYYDTYLFAFRYELDIIIVENRTLFVYNDKAYSLDGGFIVVEYHIIDDEYVYETSRMKSLSSLDLTV
jgi:hypothetical protein